MRRLPVDSGAPDDGIERLDLGCVRIPVQQGIEVRVDFDESHQQPANISIFLGHSIVALQAFAVPRYEEKWPGVRDDIVKQLALQGIEATVVLGQFGTEIHTVMPTIDYDGSNVVQSVRFLGIDGPRWFLRVVVSGDGAFSGDIAAQIDELIASFVVHRGDEPMADGEPLPVVLPNGN
jgi:hypothetical protein